MDNWQSTTLPSVRTTRAEWHLASPTVTRTVTVVRSSRCLPDFGRIEYEYPIALNRGATYELLLNIGGGRFVNINTIGVNGARVSVNGKYIGDTPIYNYYMAYGNYKLVAVRNRYEGEAELRVVEKTQNDNKQLNFNVPMIDQTAMRT